MCSQPMIHASDPTAVLFRKTSHASIFRLLAKAALVMTSERGREGERERERKTKRERGRE